MTLPRNVGLYVTGFLLFAASALPHAIVWAAPPQETAPIKSSALHYIVTNLPNGLKVVTLEDHRAPVVTVQVWYHVGSKDEAVGKAGFAHLFEHLMFKGSDHVAPEEHSKYIEQIGGNDNANTSFDRTLYFETVSSNALDRVLFLEADRMASLHVDQANLDSERKVVEEEYRLRVTNAPYGKLFEDVQSMLFPPGHPYAHTTIGEIADLDQAQLADVQAFHDMYYRPDNATLVLVGDFTTSRALEKVQLYFGSIPRSVKPFVRYPVVHGEQTSPRRTTFYDKLAQLPMIGMAFRLPPAQDPDLPVFTVISQILSVGESSRMHRSLVRDKQLAVDAGGEALPLKLGGFFFFYAIGSAGKDPMTVEKALQEQVDLLQTGLVSAKELTKAKNQALTARVFGSLSTAAKADQLGEADLLYDNPEEANRELSKLNAVTAADIQRVARKYFDSGESNVFHLLPIAMAPKPGK